MSIFLKQFETQAAYEAAQSSLILPNVSLIDETNGVEYNPYVDPCKKEKIETTYEWIEIGGKKWATKNVGALTETDYGQYFSWGDPDGYTLAQASGGCKEFAWEDYKFWTSDDGSGSSGLTKYNDTDGKLALDSDDDMATVNMGSDWRMPTKDEYVALGNAVNTAWTEDYQGSGVAGMICTDKKDSSKVLFFPACGSCHHGAIYSVGDDVYYWSKTRVSGSTNVKLSYMMRRTFSMRWDDSQHRYFGHAVRGIFVG